MAEVSINLGAMTMSTDVLEQMIEQMEESGDAEASAEAALGAVAEEAVTEDGLTDPKRLVKDRLAERTRQLCPDFADVIVG